ncbi:hypothetical protein Tco_1410667 [Tanacetum coccineum]
MHLHGFDSSPSTEIVVEKSIHIGSIKSVTIYFPNSIEQFWTSTKANIVNGERQIQALVGKNKVIITETSIRSNLKLDDADGTDCLPTATIFAELERMGYENLTQKLTFYKGNFSSQWKFLTITTADAYAKTTSWNEFRVTMASTIICLATNKNFNSKYIFDNMVKNLEGGVKIRCSTDSHSTSFILNLLHPKPQKKKSRRKYKKDSGPTEPIPDEAINEEHVATPSCDPPKSGKDRMQLTELMDL